MLNRDSHIQGSCQKQVFIVTEKAFLQMSFACLLVENLSCPTAHHLQHIFNVNAFVQVCNLRLEILSIFIPPYSRSTLALAMVMCVCVCIDVGVGRHRLSWCAYRTGDGRRSICVLIQIYLRSVSMNISFFLL